MNKKSYKILLIIIFNIIFLILLFCFFNFYFYYTELKSRAGLKDIYQNYIAFLKRDISEKNTYYNLIEQNNENINEYQHFRNAENINSDKPPILLFGCSFVQGMGLNDNETFSHQLAEYTHRPVYSRAKAGWGVQHMLYQLKNKEFYNIIPKPEYVIYVYYDGHLTRMNYPITVSMPDCYGVFYKEKNGEYILKKRTFFSDKIVFLPYIMNRIDWNILNKFDKYKQIQYKRLLNYILESQKEIKKHWGNDVKFVVLCYSYIDEPILQQLNKAGIITITNDDYKIDVSLREYIMAEGDTHPNAKAWEVIVPVISKKLNLK